VTQCEKILRYMELHGSITARQALNECGVMRLAARIHDLREAGHDIRMELITVRTRSGKAKVGRYSLNAEQDY